MHKHIVLAAVVAFGLASPAHADTTAAPAPTSVVEQPWVKAQIVLDATVADVGKGGVRAVATHVSDLEAAMAAVNAPDAASGDASDSGPIYVLADGLEETLFALAAVSAAAKNNPHMSGRKIIAVANPYPGIGLYLGSYYNEIGKPQEALRILDAGLAQFGNRDMPTGTHLAKLISERAIALTALDRWTDALAGYDDGLALNGIENGDRARLLRGRGYVLTELGRLDEAEQAYHESLKLEPDNKIAQGELEYIARLRAGSAKEPGGITLPSKTQ